MVVRELGVPTPEFAVVERMSDLDSLQLPYPLFVKPVAEGSSKGIGPRSRVAHREELMEVCRDLLGRFDEPVLVETYLPGREFTVGIIGTGASAEAVAVLEVLLVGNAEPESYSYTNKQDYYTRVRYRLAEDASAIAARDMALTAWRGLGCRDGGRIDLRCDALGRPNFLEVNPLPGLHPVNSDLVILSGLRDISHPQLIGAIFESALQRTPAQALLGPKS
jgi:D-alanine-D-alanine ligase